MRFWGWTEINEEEKNLEELGQRARQKPFNGLLKFCTLCVSMLQLTSTLRFTISPVLLSLHITHVIIELGSTSLTILIMDRTNPANTVPSFQFQRNAGGIIIWFSSRDYRSTTSCSMAIATVNFRSQEAIIKSSLSREDDSADTFT